MKRILLSVVLMTQIVSASVRLVTEPDVIGYVRDIVQNFAVAKGISVETFYVLQISGGVYIPRIQVAKNLAQGSRFLMMNDALYDMIHQLVSNPKLSQYDLKLTDAGSPYSMTVSIPRERLSALVEAIFQQALGHLCCEEHLKLHVGYGIAGLAVTIPAVINLDYQKLQRILFAFDTTFGEAIKASFKLLVLSSMAQFSVRALINGTTKTKQAKAYEADDFVVSTIEVLKGLEVYLQIEELHRRFISSYGSSLVCLHASIAGLDCAEYVKRNPVKSHWLAAVTSGIPTFSSRMRRISKRINSIADTKNLRPVTVSIYKDDVLVDQEYFA